MRATEKVRKSRTGEDARAYIEKLTTEDERLTTAYAASSSILMRRDFRNFRS